MRKRERKQAEKEIEESDWGFGFSVIKNSIITPLIMASERCVEYIKQTSDEQPIEEKMDALSLDEKTGRKRLRRKVSQDKLKIVDP